MRVATTFNRFHNSNNEVLYFSPKLFDDTPNVTSSPRTTATHTTIRTGPGTSSSPPTRHPCEQATATINDDRSEALHTQMPLSSANIYHYKTDDAL
ncbi:MULTISPECIES: hypothetical protein [Corynebacterium]|uniref:Uncharacterized protein n=2 Tax=Corynebacterium glucuronolyticum TaxID=39791 RepID=A0A7T4EHE6_9CORY|nr:MULTISPECIES: hypothetical protein [Corynebacterium]EEI62305.1 hypothetical protein HMPREF0293_2219 [Corynebacterium glucuronolyticum ATCC 51866]MDH4659382.1 hypothetical protein [Corynebacterium pyruviciproducens]QQB47428.1 hypothetical protein I6I10_05960 [Corynebacterium glucuronolyticum]QRP70026.1 hypothetical protein I6J21_09570 [Corynebacterium glucuronolyticum]WKD64235.1 hypothetical protein CGLUCO_09985 [Corynebacterium glucuronolyticum DSM 44120]